MIDLPPDYDPYPCEECDYLCPFCPLGCPYGKDCEEVF